MKITPWYAKSYFVAFFLATILFQTQVKAQQKQPGNCDIGERVVLHSKILGEDREIFIYAPKNADQTDKPSPVLYTLDAENHFNLLVEYAKSLSRWDVGVTPSLIIVGIKNTNRLRDLTPSEPKITDSTKNKYKVAGGNEKFFQFISEELKPYVAFNYKTMPYTILAGHSLGGITSINCMLQHPEMFNAYIAASPSFWWDDNYMLKLANEKLKAGMILSKTLFFSDGNEGTYLKSAFHTNVLKFDSLLRERNIKGLNSVYQYYPLENHGTVPYKTYFEALRFIYKDWEIPSIENEELDSSFAIKHYGALSRKFGYRIVPQEELINDWAEYLTAEKFTRNAISLLELALSYYPKSLKTFINLTEAYQANGDKSKAIKLCKKAAELHPGSAEIELKLKELQK